MTVAELIAYLQTQPQDLQIVYQIYGQYCRLEPVSICIAELGMERPDGWVHERRSDRPSRRYLVLPRN